MHRPPSDLPLIAFSTLALFCAATLIAAPDQKKKKEELTQTLELPKELPNVLTGDPRRFTFQVTPLSAKGLLSQQMRDALKALDRQAGSDTVLKLRAFVAGSGDMRRVRDLVSEEFTDRRQPLPVLSLVRAGGLPMEGAQVVLEAISVSRKEVNPSGLAFIAPHVASGGRPTDPVAPLTEKSLAGLKQALKAAGSEPADMLRVTCFLSSLENLTQSRRLVEAEYPKAAFHFLQTQRVPFEGQAACEGVARMRAKIASRVEIRSVTQSADSGASDIAMVPGPAVVLTGTQNSFGYEEKDARLAFDRLGKALEQAGVTKGDVVYAHYYPLAPVIARQIRTVRGEFFDRVPPPAGSMLIFEGLPSMDAGFAVDVIAVKP